MIATISEVDAAGARAPAELPDAAASALAPLTGRLGDATLLVNLHDHEHAELVVVAAADGAGLGVRAGARQPFESSFCSAMAADLAVQLCNDIEADPLYRACGTRSGLAVGSYLGVPIELEDGTRVGSVCALHGDRGRFGAADQDALRTAADGLAAELGRRGPDERSGAQLRREAARTPHARRIGQRARLAFPFYAVMGLAFLTALVLPTRNSNPGELMLSAGLAVAIFVALLTIPWARMPEVLRMAPVFGFFAVIALMRDAEGGAASGFSVLLLLPVLWTALYGSRLELLLAVAGAALTVLLPPILIGGEAYPTAEFRRGVAITAVALVMGAAIQHVVGLAAARAADVRRRSREMHASEEEKRLILATAGEGIIGLDDQGHATFVNPAASALTGFAPGELTGRPVDDLVNPAQVRATLRDGETRRVETSFRRKDRTAFSADCTVRPLWRSGRIAGVVMTFNDTTERRKAERALLEEREFLRAMLKSLDEGIVAIGEDGGMRLHNDAARDMLGADPLAAAPEGPLEQALRGDRVAPAEVPVGERILHVTGQPFFDDGGAKLGAVVALQDVTERRRAEKLKDEFFALVSHELRTPLTSIVGYLEVLREDAEEDDAFGDDHRRFLHVIDRNARRLQRLVGDLLFVAQLEAGRLSLEAGSVDLAARAAEAVEAGLPRAAEAGVELLLDAQPVSACKGDNERVGQVLDNLVANAVKFTPGGGRVLVRVRQEDDRAVIEVADTGVGIPAGEVERLFERFFRASTATERQIPGIGLGLSISRAIVQAHGGDIDVASVEGEGTTFRVELPVC